MRRIDKKKEILTYYKVKPINMDLVVFFSRDLTRLAKHLNMKKNKHLSDYVKRQGGQIEVTEANGAVLFNQETRKPYLIMLVNNGRLDWEFYETIIHETNHLSKLYAEAGGFQNELEFNAYLQQSLFTDIRRIIEK